MVREAGTLPDRLLISKKTFHRTRLLAIEKDLKMGAAIH